MVNDGCNKIRYNFSFYSKTTQHTILRMNSIMYIWIDKNTEYTQLIMVSCEYCSTAAAVQIEWISFGAQNFSKTE